MTTTSNELVDFGHYNFSDVGNADRFNKQWQTIAKYCYERRKWLVWDDSRGFWVWDTGALIGLLARITVRDIYEEASDETDDNTREKIAQHALKSESDTRINGMINQAQSMSFIPYSKLDRNFDLLNVQNGTIDLKTGQLQKHEPKDYITHQLPLYYHPESTCPQWLKFLAWFTCDDVELQGYLQRAVGYSLTGDVNAQVIFMLYGLGSNGKSTFTGVIRKMLGEYADKIDVEDLLLKEKGGGGAKPGIANLESKRFVLTSEIPQGRKLNTGLIKDLSGEATIKARRLYENGTEFDIHCKLWLQGNHMPEIADTTLSIWRRVKLIKCDATISDSDRIDGYMEKYLFPELEGILAWAVQGAVNYFNDGLGHAEAIKTATDTYRHDSDILIDFIDDNCVLEAGATVAKSELKKRYQEWCAENGIEPVSQKTFKSRMVERGVKDYRVGKGRSWRGIRLLTNDELVTGVTRVTPFPDKVSSRRDFIGNFSENAVEMSQLKLSSDKTFHGQLPDCPKCGANEWGYLPDAKTLKCPCGYEMESHAGLL